MKSAHPNPDDQIPAGFLRDALGCGGRQGSRLASSLLGSTAPVTLLTNHLRTTEVTRVVDNYIKFQFLLKTLHLHSPRPIFSNALNPANNPRSSLCLYTSRNSRDVRRLTGWVGRERGFKLLRWVPTSVNGKGLQRSGNWESRESVSHKLPRASANQLTPQTPLPCVSLPSHQTA